MARLLLSRGPRAELTRFEALALRAHAERFGSTIAGLAAGQGYVFQVDELPLPFEGRVKGGVLHLRASENDAILVTRGLHLLASEILTDAGEPHTRLDVWRMTAHLAEVSGCTAIARAILSRVERAAA